jgi:hypothetical protein
VDVNVNVKGLDADVVARLAEQANAEGVSAQEWMRRALRRTAALLTPNELNARVGERTPIDADRFAETMRTVAARRAAGLASLASNGPGDVPDRGR